MSAALLVIAMQAASASQPAITEVPRISVLPPKIVVVQRPEELEIVPLRIEVRQGRDVLWRGTLNVQSNANSIYSESVSQPAEGCTRPNYRNMTRRGLTVNISRYSPGDQVDNFHVNVRWERPGEPASPDCQRNSRIVEFGQTVTLAAGKETVVTGDAGLSVSLSRPKSRS